MPLRIIWIPTFKVPETVTERVPALAKVRSTLRSRYEVQVFDWMLDRGVNPADLIRRLVDALRDRDCVISEAPAMPLLLSALQSEPRTPPATVALGMWMTNRTLRALGLAGVVRADQSLTETGGRLRQDLEFLGQLIGNELVADLEQSVPWDAVYELEDWQHEINLLDVKPFPTVDALLFSSGRFPLLAEGEMEQIFQRIFPQATAATLHRYPFGLQDVSVADEVIDQLIPFLDSVAERTA